MYCVIIVNSEPESIISADTICYMAEDLQMALNVAKEKAEAYTKDLDENVTMDISENSKYIHLDFGGYYTDFIVTELRLK